MRAIDVLSPGGIVALVIALVQVARPAGSISGRVVDASSGQPLAAATVQISRLSSQTGSAPLPQVVTNDRGEFSFTNLPPGRYDLSARKNRYIGLSYGQRAGSGMPGVSISVTDARQVTDLILRLPVASVIAGAVTDTRGEPIQGAGVQLYRLQWRNGERDAVQISSAATTDDRGQFRVFGLTPGEYIVAASTTPAVRSLPYTTYFPGTPVPALAVPVTVGAGEERNGVNFQLSAMPLSSVTGTVTSTDGKSMPNIRVVAIDATSALTGVLTKQTYSTATGAFRFDGLAPGRYQLHAWDDRSTGPLTRFGIGEIITAAGNPVDDVSLVLREGDTVSGALIVVGPGSLLEDPRLTLLPLDKATAVTARIDSRLNPDGRFSFQGVMPGRYLLTASTPTAGFLITSVRLGGREVGDRAIDIRQATEGLEVRMSSKSGSVSGTVFDSSGRPTSDLLAIIFPADEEYWLPTSQRIKIARPGDDGGYTFRSLPPGSYRIGVVTDAEPGEWFAPSFLKKITPASIAVLIQGEDNKTVDLRAR